ncbi:hypothetical protein MRX96_024441 [Rhipicephalus microplus]
MAFWKSMRTEIRQTGYNESIRRSSPWKMVPPALFITCIFSLLVLTCAILLTIGQAGFCNSLERHTFVSCSDAQELPWKPDVIKMANFHTLFTRAEVSACALYYDLFFIPGHLACGGLLVPQLCPCCAVAASFNPDVSATVNVVPTTTTTA